MTALSRTLFITSTLFVLFISFGEVANAQSCSGGAATGCISKDGSFTVTVTGVTGAAQVWFPTWSNINGQDDLVWYVGQNLGGGTWRLNANRSSHQGPGGVVTTHVYMDTDGSTGNGVGNFCDGFDIPICSAWTSASFSQYEIYPGQSFPNISAQAWHLNITSQSSTGGGTASASNDWCGQTGVGSAMSCLWNNGGTGNCAWPSTATANQVGCSRDYYQYGYNVDGQQILMSGGTPTVYVNNPPPPTVDIWTNPTSVVSGNYNTYGWSTSNATYCRFYINGAWAGDTNNSWPFNNGGWGDGPHTAAKTYTIECSNASGWSSDTATLSITPPPSCSSAAPQAANTTMTSGTFYTYAYGVQNATAVNFAVWGDPGGQDDLVWYVGQNIGGGTWRAAINMANHKAGNPEYGNFNVHVYMNGPAANNQPCSTNGASNFTRSQVNNSSCVGITGVPATLTQGQTFTPVVTFNNNGTKQWNSDATPHSIGSANPSDNWTWGTNRRPVPAAINPGGNAAFTWTATAPTTPGSYNFAWQMVEDGIEWFGPVCTTPVNVVNAPPSLDNLTISSPVIVANNTTQYTISVSASDPSGAAQIGTAAALINYQGGNAGQYRGYLTWGPSASYSGWQDAKACGGGHAGVYPGNYGNTYLTLDSCSISDSGNTRTVNFVVRFNSTFTAPVTGNDISGFVRDLQGYNNPESWKNYDLNFSLGQRLTTTKAGSTGGTITANVGGINCGATCVYDYAYGTVVTLTASPSAGHSFTGWSGEGCSGTGSCTVTMTAARNVTATFADVLPTVNNVTINSTSVVTNNSNPYTITHTASDAGGVIAQYALINYQGGNMGAHRGYLLWALANNWPSYKDHRACSGGGYAVIYPGYGDTYLRLDSCSTSVAGSTRTTSFVVRFDPSYTTPVTGNDISGYVIDSAGQAQGWFNFDTNFNLSQRLTTIRGGSTGGTITANTGPISCGVACDAPYNYGTVVTLTATPSAGHSFTGWSGEGCSGTGSCTVTMTAARTVTANFALAAPVVSVTATTPFNTNVTGSVITHGGTQTLNWSATNGATSCSVYRNSAAPSLVGTYPYPGTSAYTVPSVTATAGTADSYYVTCTNGTVGTGNTITFTVPPPPTSPTVSCSPAGTSATIGWTLPAGYTLNYIRGHYTAVPFACDGSDLCLSSSGNSHVWSPINANQSLSWWVHARAANNAYGGTVGGTFTCVPASYTLTVAKNGTGGGTVTSNPGSISCGATCSAPYSYGTLVQLTAAPAVGSVFAGWSGGGCSGTGTCSVTMTAAQNVTATFNTASYALTVAKNGTGLGTVTSNPAGISCGVTCSSAYNYNTSVTLTATPNAGHTFAGWSGSGCTGTGTCVTTVTGTQSVTATFNALPDLYSTNNGPAANSVFSSTGAINFTGFAVNTNAATVSQGNWADLEVDWDSDGTYTWYNAFNNIPLGSFTPGQSKALSYTVSNPSVGTHRYRFNVDTSNGLTESDEANNRSAWVTFRVASGSVTATPTTIQYGATTTITWNSVGTSGLTCGLTGGSDSWSGTSGSQEKVLTTDTTYTFSCNGTALASFPITVDVTPELTRIGNRVVEPDTRVEFQYDTNGQSGCSISGIGNIGQGSGSAYATVTAATEFVLTCPVGSDREQVEIPPETIES